MFISLQIFDIVNSIHVILYVLHVCVGLTLCLFYAFQRDEGYEDAVHSIGDSHGHLQPKPLASLDNRHLIFQSNAEIEFPTVMSGKPKIPHIMHNVYKNDTVPFGFVRKLRSFHAQNSKWKFRFWTFKTGRQLIKKQHPYLLNTFDSWKDNQHDNEKKSNMIRYVAIYEYGGVSADLDVYNRRPLDLTTMKYSCIVSTEPFEHCALIYNFDVILSSSIVLCRARHPFFSTILDDLRETDLKYDTFHATGGGFLTSMFMIYNNLTAPDLKKRKIDNSSNSPFFYKGKRSENAEDAVYIPNTQYFMGDVNHLLLNSKGNLKECSRHEDLKSYLVKRACAEFDSRVELRKKQKYAFTLRLWHHVWTKHYTTRKVHINKIIPNVILYDNN